MQAVQYDAYGATPTLVDLPAPDCPADGVLVEVRATGVCRSDWHAWQGHDPVPLPQVPGHEFAGVISAVGPQVTTRRVGERVTAPFVCGCGRCAYCAAGDAQVCPDQSQPGFTQPGSFADLVAVPAADLNVVPLPDGLDFVTAASLGCRFATAYRALTAHGRVRPGDWVAVHGCGGVGLSAVMIAAALGARVVAVDVSEPALRLAAELGAEVLVEGGPDAARRVVDATGGGAHVSLDAVGSTDTAVASVCSLRPRGRHVQVGLLLGEHATPPLPMGAGGRQGARDPRLPRHGRPRLPGDARPRGLRRGAAGPARRLRHRARRCRRGPRRDEPPRDDRRRHRRTAGGWGRERPAAGLRPARPPQAAAALRPSPRAGRGAALVGAAEGAAVQSPAGPAGDRRRRPCDGPPHLRGRRQVRRRHRLVGGRRQQRTPTAVHAARA